MSKNLEIITKLSSGNTSDWLKDAKRRQRYSLWYDLKFYLALKWLSIKRYINK